MNHGIYELPDSPIPELDTPLKPWEQHIVENIENPWEHLWNFQVHGLHPTFDIAQCDLLFCLPFFVWHHWLNIHTFYYDIDIEDLIHQRYLGTHTDISQDYCHDIVSRQIDIIVNHHTLWVYRAPGQTPEDSDDSESFHLHTIANEETTQVDNEVDHLTIEELVRYYTQHAYIILYQRPGDISILEDWNF